MTDLELLKQYGKARSQEAFAELVRRHLEWVYGAAKRLVHDRELAEDVTQGVFLALSRAKSLGREQSLSPWLLRVTRCAAISALRAVSRRQRHERKAAAMRRESTAIDSEAQWEEVAPLLDEQVLRLGKKDQEAILLRFYERTSFAEVGAAMGLSEEAAKKRVQRAVEKLRGMLAKKGVTGTTAGLSAVLVGNVVGQTPQGLMEKIVSAVGSGRGNTVAAGIAKGAMKMMVKTKMKVAVAVVVASVVAIAGLVPLLAQQPSATTQATAQPDSALPYFRRAVELLGAGDVDGFQQYVHTSNDVESSMIRGLLHYVVARRHYAQALRKQFGDGWAAAVDVQMGGELPQGIAEKVQEDRALITVPGRRTRQTEMIRVKGVWKLTYAEALSGAALGDTPPSRRLAAKLEDIAQAVETEVKELESHRYGTAAEAIQSMAWQMGQSGNTFWQQELEQLVDQGLPATRPWQATVGNPE